jgi:hypothetical protein
MRLANNLSVGADRVRTFQGGRAATIMTLSLLLTAVSRGDEPSAHHFDIPAQSLSSALNEFAQQSQQQILFAPDIVAQKLSLPLHGDMQPLAALKVLLKDSGLTFKTTPNGAILVGNAREPRGAAAGPRSKNANPPSNGISTVESTVLPEVTVTAPRLPTPEELAGEAVPNFVASHAVPSIVIRQLMRWRTGICPVTLGLSPSFNTFVSARIHAVAAAVGAPHQAVEKCKPNVLILFTTEPQRQLEEVVKLLGPAALGFHYSPQTKRLMTFDRPVQGWYQTATRNFRGLEVADDPLPMPALSLSIWDHTPVPGGEPGSRLTNLRVSLIIQATAIVDANKMAGKSIESISDYLAMMVLSQSKSPDTCGQLPSVIDLMASNCAEKEKPTQITAGDLAFLRALYSINLEEPLELERDSLEDSIVRQFKGR